MEDDEFKDPIVMFINMTRSLRSKVQILRIDMQNISHPMVYAYAEKLLWEYERDLCDRLMYLRSLEKEGQNNEEEPTG
jgi:hypothetical protein